MKKLVIVFGLIAAGVLGFTLLDEEQKPNELLLDRVWIERIPTSPTDMIAQFAMISDQKMGVAARGSQWRQMIDIFKYRGNNAKFRLGFPQDKRRLDVSMKAWRCEAPKPFQLCLEIKAGDRTAKLFSRDDWTLDGAWPEFVPKPQFTAVDLDDNEIDALDPSTRIW